MNASKEPKEEGTTHSSEKGADRPIALLLTGGLAGVVSTVFLLSGYIALPDWSQEKWERFSAIVRNFGLLVVAVPALILAWHRTQTASRQADTSNRQTEIANDQVKLAEKGLIIDRFQKGAQMLESEELAVRLAGIYALRELVKSDPTDTYIMVLDLLFDFVREESKCRVPDGTSEYPPFPPDLQKALNVASFLRESVPSARQIEKDERWKPFLNQADLTGSSLSGLNVSNASFVDANLQDVNLFHTNLNGATLVRTNMFRASLGNTNLRGAELTNVNMFEAYISGTNFSYCHLNIVNLSSTHFRDPKLQDANVTALWAYKGAPPIDAPKQFRAVVAEREISETWEHFVRRIIKERPELGWNAAYVIVGGE